MWIGMFASKGTVLLRCRLTTSLSRMIARDCLPQIGQLCSTHIYIYMSQSLPCPVAFTTIEKISRNTPIFLGEDQKSTRNYK